MKLALLCFIVAVATASSQSGWVYDSKDSLQTYQALVSELGAKFAASNVTGESCYFACVLDLMCGTEK